jgi:hypothetical protein
MDALASWVDFFANSISVHLLSSKPDSGMACADGGAVGWFVCSLMNFALPRRVSCGDWLFHILLRLKGKWLSTKLLKIVASSRGRIRHRQIFSARRFAQIESRLIDRLVQDTKRYPDARCIILMDSLDGVSRACATHCALFTGSDAYRVRCAAAVTT